MCNKRRVVVALLIGFAFLWLAKHAYAQTERTSQPTNPVLLNTTVVNGKGELVNGLQKDDFQVFLDNKPESIVAFDELNAPVSVGILFDASGSMGNERTTDRRMIKTWQAALKVFLENSNKSNEYFLMAFNYKPQLLVDWSSDANVIVESLLGVTPTGNTAFYDACYLAIDKVQRGRHSRHVLILITDGLDTNSTYYLGDVKQALRNSDVLIYSLNFTREEEIGSAMGTESLEILKELSSISGGEFFFKRTRFLKLTDAVPVFELIAMELAHQYRVGIDLRASTADTKWHKLKVKVTGPADASGKTKKLSARTRDGIYVTHR